MAFIPLTYKNFVKNKVKNTLKVNYKNSDTSTYVYDNILDTKSILYFDKLVNLDHNVISSITKLQGDANTTDNIDKIISFFELSNFQKDKVNTQEDYLTNKNTFIDGSDNGVKNDNIKAFNFRNVYKIDRIEQEFLPQSFNLQKKNYLKNNLYNAYKRDFSLDFYNNLDFGYCNWNSINFFSQRIESDRNHTNCIIYPNSKDTSKNQYNFINTSFNVTFYLNKRIKYENSLNPECLVHIPDLLSLYTIKTLTGENYKIGIVLGSNSKNKLVDISNYNKNTDNTQKLASNSVYVTSDLNVSNNRWYNISLNFNKNVNNTYNIELFIDGSKHIDENLTITKDLSSVFNSYVCLGNKPDYAANTNYEHVFYQAFARNFDKDISLGRRNVWKAENSEIIDTSLNSYTGNITFEKSVNSNSESFHGEIHDFRIYGQSLDEDKIKENCNKIVQNIQEESLNYNLQFYLPLFYIPSFSKRKSSFNASGTKINLKYSCIYNPILANTCGGLESSSENYLLEFINHSKPNVTIGGSVASHVYDDNITNSISALVHSQNDVNSIKKGKLTHNIYNDNFNTPSHSGRQYSLDSNLSYRNLLVLPNDNGIQSVEFDIINEFLIEYGKDKYDSSQIDISKLFHVNITNIFNKENYNKSWNNDVSLIENMPFDRIVWGNNPERGIQSVITIAHDDPQFTIINPEFNIVDDFSNIIYHDNRIVNIEDLNPVLNNISFFNEQNDFKNKIKDIYSITESNPVLRNYKQSINNTGITSSHFLSTESLEYKDNVTVDFLKLPIPYSVFNIDYDSIFISIFDISSKMYNKKINRDTFNISDSNLDTTNQKISLSFKDNNGLLYRNDCLTKVADWNYVGHLFYKEGIFCLNRPELYYFGKNDFECNFESDFFMFVNEINIPAVKGMHDSSQNNTYDSNLRQDESAFNSEDSFVYITDINLHDENLNIVGRAKLARPATKKRSDSILFRLKMDY
jgi:hypothetical protein